MILAGIDGGATTTRSVLASETGSILGYGTSGPSNYDNVGIEKARTNIAVHQAFVAAGTSAPADAAFFGMAGVVSEKDRGVIRNIALSCNVASAKNIDVDHDIRIALAGGLAGKEGIVLIAGTGSSCYGRRNDGRNHRTGWGYLLDDLGSGYFLGMQAMIAAIQEADGRAAPTVLSVRLQERLGYAHIDDIMRILYHDHLPVTDIAAFAPMVLEAAEIGDAVAMHIVERGARELSRTVEAVSLKLEFRAKPVQVTYAGGLMESAFYRGRVQSAIKERVEQCVLHDPELPPILGAALLAFETAHIPITGGVIEMLKHDSAKLQQQSVDNSHRDTESQSQEQDREK